MKRTIAEYGVNIINYCLMPNHYHFLLQQTTIRPLSDWLKALFISYTLAVNRQQHRRGTLFAGRAKHRVITKEDYLIYLMGYIHSNPVEAGLVSEPEEWEFSNYRECTGKRNGALFNRDFILNRFGSFSDYEKWFQKEYRRSTITSELKECLFDAE